MAKKMMEYTVVDEMGRVFASFTGYIDNETTIIMAPNVTIFQHEIGETRLVNIDDVLADDGREEEEFDEEGYPDEDSEEETE